MRLLIENQGKTAIAVIASILIIVFISQSGIFSNLGQAADGQNTDKQFNISDIVIENFNNTEISISQDNIPTLNNTEKLGNLFSAYEKNAADASVTPINAIKIKLLTVVDTEAGSDALSNGAVEYGDVTETVIDNGVLIEHTYKTVKFTRSGSYKITIQAEGTKKSAKQTFVIKL